MKIDKICTKNQNDILSIEHEITQFKVFFSSQLLVITLLESVRSRVYLLKQPMQQAIKIINKCEITKGYIKH